MSARLQAFCTEHWLKLETLNPAQRGRAEQLAAANMSTIPERLRGGLVRYIVKGIPTGHFLQAVISNDLREACARADEQQAAAITTRKPAAGKTLARSRNEHDRQTHSHP
ncbi:flagellar motor switch protein FliG [Polymorphobacter multimanifer]|uniref:Flagellar motor switch protein FliG n=1 Tax=Polymorphobacter multimanifer TaxID=1070431 RepID=A0A841LH77_9SPHN|nr:hypothetical protein [Polymorphobacter multimanifer]MBB6228318.1 flagellar motor switch protein FliG [Polymorphobacter multimanifer]